MTIPAISTQPVKAPTINEFGEKIAYTTNQVGRQIVSDGKGGVAVLDHIVPGSEWTQPAVYYSKEAVEGGWLTDPPSPFIPSPFEVQAPRVGAGGGLNRNDVDPAFAGPAAGPAARPASDPNYTPEPPPAWPFLYVAGAY